MQIEVEIHNIPIATLVLNGRIDAFNSPSLREQVDQLIKQGIYRFVVDLRQVKFLDSAGMAVLVSLLKQARLQGGNAKLIMPLEEGARRILHLTRFDRVFDLVESTKDALNNF
jgi:anti-anti-sigma factor